MTKKATIAAIKIRHEMKSRSLTAVNLASLAKIDSHSVNNILSGKSNKIEKLEAIAAALGKPLMYFVDPNFSEHCKKSTEAAYDGDLHCKVVKIINDFCKREKITLTKDWMDKLVDFTYPRLNKDDPDELILSQTEAVVKYALKNGYKVA